MNIGRNWALAFGSAIVLTVPLHGMAQQPATTLAVATAPGQAMAVEVSKASATVVGIDTASRVVTLKGPKGVFNVTAGPEVRNFDQITIGDKVLVEYSQALSLALRKTTQGVREKVERDAQVRTPLGAKPGAAVGRQVELLADVVAVNRAKHYITLRGPQGHSVELNVPDPEQLKNINKGDQVAVLYTEALAMSVQAAPAAPAK